MCARVYRKQRTLSAYLLVEILTITDFRICMYVFFYTSRIGTLFSSVIPLYKPY